MTRENQGAPQLALKFEEPRETRRIWPVRELVAQVRDSIEQRYADVWVEGEISNFRPASSGHIYFTLKDREAQLPVVLFRRQAILLRFRPEDGLHVLVRGRLSVYEQRGQLQMVAETMEPVGAGSLQLAFEQLREKLKSEGLFDTARKRSLPAFPRTVGIVTSPTGAVVRDFLNIVGRRHSGLNVLLSPVAVQGDNAPLEIERALRCLNDSGLVDVIVIARGGGSLEDLAAFNNERVARAIAASLVPVVSAVGHETDFTIADFAADLRAPTPSAAAELITAAQHDVAEQLAKLTHRLERAARYCHLQARQAFSRVQIGRAETRLHTLLHRMEQRLDDLNMRMDAALSRSLGQHRRQLEGFSSAVLHQDPRRQLAHARGHLDVAGARLQRAMMRLLDGQRSRLRAMGAQLHTLSPLAVLDRGYALVLDTQGVVIRSALQLSPGDVVVTKLSDGGFTSRVESAQAVTQKKETTL